MKILLLLLIAASAFQSCSAADDIKVADDESTLEPDYGSTGEPGFYGSTPGAGSSTESTKERPSVKIVNAGACSKTMLNVAVTTTDFAWTLAGLVKLIKHYGLQKFLTSGKAIRMKNVMILESGLTGPWDLQLYPHHTRQDGSHLRALITYNTTESPSLTITPKLVFSAGQRSSFLAPTRSFNEFSVHTEYPPKAPTNNKSTYNSYSYSYSYTTTSTTEAPKPLSVHYSYQTFFVFYCDDLNRFIHELSPGTSEYDSPVDDLDLIFRDQHCKEG